MEIAPGVHAIQLRGALGHLIVDDGLTLIDAGLPGSGSRVTSTIAGLGRAADELTRIVCTHGHPDHVGGVRELAGDRVEVFMHPPDSRRRCGRCDRNRGVLRGAASQGPRGRSPEGL